MPAFTYNLANFAFCCQARTPIRYAATKAVWATPTLFINNVPVDRKSTLADWQAVIEPLLPT